MGIQRALLVVDVQNDFCGGGALAVRDGDAVVPVVNDVARRFAAAGAPVFASRDWHPADSRHFRSQGGPWPDHCVAGTPGAAFHPALALPASAEIITKGSGRDEDGYSAFDGRTAAGEAFPDLLRRLDVRELVVAGLATDYCVRSSVLAARDHGLAVTVLTDGIRAVDVSPGDGARALDEMRRAGAVLATSAE